VDRVPDAARRLLADVPDASYRCSPGRSVARALASAAEDADAPLIVLGSTHRSGVGRVVPGATADAVIQAAPCPVAVVPARYAQGAGRRPFGLIAAAVDGGPDTERIARVAGRVAARADAALRLITVAEVPGGPEPMSAGTIGYVTIANASRDCASDALDRAVRAAGADVTVERRVAGGRVGGAVAKLSEDADLLVIGSRGHGALRRVAAGTHTGRILHAASRPVLVLARDTGEQFEEQVVALAAAGARPDPA
jgi:nucleotide-binding universal stress UspA family protein